MTKFWLATALSLSLSTFASAKDNFAFAPISMPSDGHVTLLVGEGDLSGTAAEIDAASDGALSKALENAEFKAKFGKSMHLYNIGDFTRVTVMGVGDEDLSMRQLHDLGGHIAKASDNKVSLNVVAGDLDAADLAAGYKLGAYSFKKYKSDAKDHDRTVTFMSSDPSVARSEFEGDLNHLVEGVNFTRDMGTEPGGSMYPELFAQKVREKFRGVPNVKVTVLGVREMARFNMGALMGVGKGSIHDPRLVVVEYMGDRGGSAPIALVGKGITFDTGGISIKGNSGMWLMKADLSGAAAVAGTVYAAAKRGENINLVGVMAMAENMPAEDAIRPGDVLETMSGKTIEVMSTDAEGRLVLADGVRYAQDKFEPSLLIDIATLTGSVGRALGTDYAGIMSRDKELAASFIDIGEKVGEEVWPLPLNDKHFKKIKSDIADIKSTSGSPGASIGGAVIGTFIDEDQPWIHLDIAGVDWLDSGTPTTPKGHSGWGVRFMDGVVRDRAAGN